MKKMEVYAYFIYLASNTKDSASRTGKPAEMLWKFADCGRISSKTPLTAQFRADYSHYGEQYEIKVNCGEIDTLKRSAIMKYGYNINYSEWFNVLADIQPIDIQYFKDNGLHWSRDIKPSKEAVEYLNSVLDEMIEYTRANSYVLKVADFLAILDTLGMVKVTKKKSGVILHNIQTYITSNKRSEAFRQLLEMYSI